MRLPSCRRLPQHLKMLCVTSNSLPTTEEFEQKQNLFLMCYLLFNTLSILSFRRPILYRASFLWGDLFPPSSFTDTYISSYYQLLQRHNREASRLPSHCHKDHHHRDCPSTGSSERLRWEIPSQYLMLFCCCCCYWNLWDGTQSFKGAHYSRKLLWEQSKLQFSSSCSYPGDTCRLSFLNQLIVFLGGKWIGLA